MNKRSIREADEMFRKQRQLHDAAPALLQACKAAIPEIRCLFRQATGIGIEKADRLRHGSSVFDALDLLEAAIRKAEGSK
jgi:hypothetical protein